MRVALVHDWLTGMRGGEKILRLLCELLPRADLFALIHVPGCCGAPIDRMRIVTSGLNDLPGVRHYYRHLLPLMPFAIERLDLGGYDLIVSSSHCVAKGVVRAPASVHICYCHTPMRYAWAQGPSYQKTMGLSGLALRAVRGYLRAWDRRSAGHVDGFLANSHNVAERIRRVYHRDAEVVYPPVNTDFFVPDDAAGREAYYLVVAALAPYKRVDQAISAFGRLGRPLRIIGTGQQMRRLAKSAPPNVTFMGWQSDEAVRDHYRRCRALVFPGEEDFGIVPLEAMACGTPVVAYGAGGALETVLDADRPGSAGPTGLLYTPQTAEALAATVERFEPMADRFDRQRLAAWARRFGTARFVEAFKGAARPLLRQHGLEEPWSSSTNSSS